MPCLFGVFILTIRDVERLGLTGGLFLQRKTKESTNLLDNCTELPTYVLKVN